MKKIRSCWIFMVIASAFIVFLMIALSIQHEEQTPEVNSLPENVEDIFIPAGDLEYIGYKVQDFYVVKKEFSRHYWDRLCNELILKEFEEESKAKDIFIHSYIELVGYGGREVICSYEIRWCDEGQEECFSSESLVSSSQIQFIEPEYDTSPVEFNSSKISLVFNEELGETRIHNGNKDYDVILRIKRYQDEK